MVQYSSRETITISQTNNNYIDIKIKRYIHNNIASKIKRQYKEKNFIYR